MSPAARTPGPGAAAAEHAPEEILMYWRQMCAAAQQVLPLEDPDSIEDIAASAIEVALRKWDQFDPGRSGLWAWLSMLSRYQAFDHKKRLAVRSRILKGEGKYVTADAGSGRHIASIAVRDALMTMPRHLVEHATYRAAGYGVIEAGAFHGRSRRTSMRDESALRNRLEEFLSPLPETIVTRAGARRGEAS